MGTTEAVKRDLESLGSQTFDVVVVGCGIHGVSIARDATLRGLKVAAIDMGDVSGETSHNSLKTIHGGIRYLQHFDFKRSRESINEQRYLLRNAPHLVHPLPFLMPTYGHGMRGPLAMFAGIRLYELLGIDRNRGLAEESRLKRGRILSSEQCLGHAPDINSENLTGGAVWDDAQVGHANKASLQILAHAVENGAIVANHVRAESLLIDKNRCTGVSVIDALGEATPFQISARHVVNATGPWAASWATKASEDKVTLDLPLTRSLNLVTRLPATDTAVGFESRQASDSKIGTTKRLFFAVPWNGRTMIGTAHMPDGAGGPEATLANTSDNKKELAASVDEFLREINEARPSLNLTTDDVLYCYQGLTPAEDESSSYVSRSREGRVVDHTHEDGLSNLTSPLGIKWTTARLIAERTVDIVCQTLGNNTACVTHRTPLPDDEDLLYSTRDLSDQDVEKYCHAHLEATMAASLTDMVLRRNEDLVAGYMTFETLSLIARTMSKELGWSSTDQQRELADLQKRWLPSEITASLKQGQLWSSDS